MARILLDALEGLSATREDIQAEWEKLDCDIVGRVLIIGENAVRKPMGKHSWSKQLRKAAYDHQNWKRRYKMHEYAWDRRGRSDGGGTSPHSGNTPNRKEHRLLQGNTVIKMQDHQDTIKRCAKTIDIK